MNQEIKERVEKIRKGEVPEGYQKTKVGIIPDDWNIEKFSNISTIFRGASPRPITDEKWFDENSDIGWVRISDISEAGKYLLKTQQHLSELGIEKSRFVEKNNVIMSICATVGKPKFTGIDVCIHDGFVVFEEPKINKYFLFYFLENIEDSWRRYGQTGSQMNLNTTIVGGELICIPLKSIEQEKIAEILSTWDKVIRLKEKLIEEKKEFKRGLMQNIISDQMNDDYSWKFTKFKDIFKIIKKPIDKHPEEEYKRLTVKRRLGGVQLRDIKKGKEILVDSQHIVKEGDFIISNRQVFHGAIGVVQKKLENSIVSMEYSILRCNEGFDTEFLFYCMYSPQFKKTIIQRTQGIHEEKFVFLFNEWYKTLGLHIPSIDEQKSTVSVLNNLNENIQILTNEVAQLKEQKKGLMQLLLTGIVRVEVN